MKSFKNICAYSTFAPNGIKFVKLMVDPNLKYLIEILAADDSYYQYTPFGPAILYCSQGNFNVSSKYSTMVLDWCDNGIGNIYKLQPGALDYIKQMEQS